MAKVIDATLRLIDQFTPIMRQVNQTIDASKQALNNVKSSVASVDKGFQNYTKQMSECEKVNQRTAKSIQHTGKQITDIGNKMSLLSAPLLVAAGAGIKLSSEFTDGMAKVSTAVDTTVIDMQKMKKEITDISNNTGIAVTDLAQAEYQCLSAGVQANKSTEFLGKAMITAKAGFADGSTAINSLTTVLNAYGMSAEKVTDISDQMLTAQNFGKTTFADMGQSLGNVIPIASSLNVKTEELFASIATLTRNGVQTSESITGLKAAYSNILKPSAEAGKLAESLGLEFNSAHLKSVGWAKFLQEIKEKTGGNEAQMAKLFGSVEALNTVMVLAGKGSKDFATALDMMNKSSGATEEAYNKLLTPAEQNRIAMNQLKNAGMELAQGLTPLLRSTAIAMKYFADALNNMTPAQKELLMNVGKIVIAFALFTSVLGRGISVAGSLYGTWIKVFAGIGKAGGVIKYLSKSFSGLITIFRAVGIAVRFLFMSPIGLAIMAVIGLAYLLYTNWETVKVSIIVIFETIANVCKIIFDGWLNHINIIINGVKLVFEGIINFITGIFTGNWEQAWQGVVQIFDGIFGTIAGICSNVMTTVKAIINEIVGGVNNISFTVPDWVPLLGGKQFTPNIPMLAKGTDNWPGGMAMIHDAGAEIVDLPSGSRVIPHDKSMHQEYERGKAESGKGKISIKVHIENMNTRGTENEAEEFATKIVTKIAQKLESHAMNQAEGAV